MTPSYPVDLSESTADKAAAPPPMITIFLSLLILATGYYLVGGLASHPSFGIVTMILPFFL